MLDDTDSTTTSEDAAQQPDAAQGAESGGQSAQEQAPAKKAAAKKAPAKKAAAKKAPAKKAAAKKAPAKKAVAEPAADEALPLETAPAESVPAEVAGESGGETAPEEKAPAKKAAAKKAPAKKAAAKKAPAKKAAAKKTTAKKVAAQAPAEAEELPPVSDETATDEDASDEAGATTAAPPALTFQPPDPTKATPVKRTRKKAAPAPKPGDESEPEAETPAEQPAAERPQRSGSGSKGPKRDAGDTSDTVDTGDTEDRSDDEGSDDETSEEGGQGGGNRRRRRRGGRRRRKSGGGGDDSSDSSDSSGSADDEDSDDEATSQQGGGEGRSGNGGNGENGGEGSGSSRRRRRRRRAGEDGDGGQDDPENTVTRVRKQRSPEDEITALSGSTRLEAKKQRRREGREAGRRRAPIVSEAEFLARREAVDRVMVIRQRKDLTQIAVLEDKVLVEHYVARESQTSLIGNVYLGRVQNVLPSMEAAFIDIGKGRNAVLYAGEVNWDALGAGNGPRKIEQVLKSGQSVLVQVTKDPIGHKGARLTSQISLPGRFLVYVPDGTTSGISRKLPDTERNRLKSLLKEIVPDTAGVIVRTAAEGASEEELTLDVERLTARWEDISSKVAKGNAPALLYGEPDLTLKVVRDLFTEDFGKLVVSGDGAWDMVEDYVRHVAPDLSDRLERYDGDKDVFAAYRIDEQIAKALDRKVWLPSGGSLIIDRTEAMTVVDVNTGKFTGSGGNLEETVTKNNLEAAEEIVRQLRLRDIGGIIVVDFIDMVLESNRDLVLRRMVECLGRDRTRHQVAEVTSLGLVQMTRKRIGTGLLEAFSESCEHCQGRGLMVHHEPVESKKTAEEEPRRGRRSRGRGKGEDTGNGAGSQSGGATPSPKDVAAMAKPPTEPPAEQAEDRTDRRPAAEKPALEEPAAEKPAEEEPAAEKPVAEKPAAEKPVEEEPAAEKPEAGTATSAPKVVTTTRRRSARRPAGQPASSGDTAGAGSAVPQQAQPAQPEPVVAAVSQPEVAPVAPPRVVTTSRRGVARRPSGPPVTDAEGPSNGDAPSSGPAPAGSQDSGERTDQTPGQDPDEGGSERRIAVHVPVKNKGSRKR